MPLFSRRNKPTGSPAYTTNPAMLAASEALRASRDSASGLAGLTLRAGNGPGAQDEGSTNGFGYEPEIRREQTSGPGAEPEPRSEATSNKTLLADDIKVAGEEIVSEMFLDLSRDIVAWSENFLMIPSMSQGVSSDLVYNREVATKLLEKVIVFEENRAHKLKNLDQEAVRVLYQAIMWHELDRQVFQGMVWAGGECIRGKASGDRCEPRKILTQSDEYFRDAYNVKVSSRPGLAPLNKYLEWRTHTTLAILPLIHTECTAKRIDAVVNSILNIFQNTGLDIIPQPGPGVWFEPIGMIVQKIVRKAVDLDQQWHLQQKSFYLLMNDKRLRARFIKRVNAYDPTHMRRHEQSPSYIEYDPSQRQTIMLVIRPGLYKGSHSDGNTPRVWEVAAEATVEIGVTTTAPLEYGGGAGDFD